MAENQNLRVNIIGDSSKLNQALGKAEGRLRKFSGKLKNISQTLTTRLTLPLAAAGGFAIKMASDMEESLNKVNVAFGDSADKVKDFAKTSLTSFGISEGAALDMTAMFGDMATSMGLTQNAAADMSVQMASLAGDLSSFKNIPVEQAMTALAGVFTGETESLKRLGIVMTEVNLKAFALEQGITKQYKEMSQAEKVALRFQYILTQTGNAQGDFARTSEGAANQMRIFTQSLKEIAAELGEIILPTFTKFLTKINNVLKRFRELSTESKQLVLALAGAAGLAPVLVYLATLFAPLITAVSSLGAGYVALGVGIYAATEAFDALIQRFTKLKNFDIRANLLGPVGQLLQVVKEIGKQKIADIFKIEEPEKVSEDFIGPLAPGQTRILPDPLLENINKLNNDLSETNNIGRETASVLSSITTNGLKPMTGAAVEAGEIIGESITPTLNLFKNFGQQILPQVGQALADSFAAIADGESPLKRLITVIKALVVRLVAAAAAAAVLSFLLPGGGTKAAKAITFANTFKSLIGMANGGLAFGQTPVMVGDYSGVRSNPEVIAPLNKLQAMIGNGSQNVQGEFVLRGQDLVVALQRAERNRNRFK